MLGRCARFVGVVSVCLAVPGFAQQPPAGEGAKDHVAAVKESLQKSMAALRHYEWVETTAVSVKGEEKSRTQSNCYYGTDGKLQKIPIGAPPEQKSPRGLRGKVVANKKEEMSDAMKDAVGLVKHYVPPDPAKIQAAKDSGKLSLTPPDAQGVAKVAIKDYLKPGDMLTFDLNVAADRIARVAVSTFTDTAKDAVNLKVDFGAFADGTVYPAKINLDVKAQDLGVAIENTGYKKLGP